MIAIETYDGQLVKVLNNVDKAIVGIHQLFGFSTQDNVKARLKQRKRAGFEFTNDSWRFQCELIRKEEEIQLKAIDNCDISKEKDGSWKVVTASESYIIRSYAAAKLDELLSDHQDENSYLSKLVEFVFLAIFILTPIFYFAFHESKKTEKVEMIEKVIEVKVIKPQKAVVVKNKVSSPNIKTKPLSKAEVTKRAVKKNLAFLGMLGSKDMKKVVGGVPQELKKATVGAGKGGDAGSGGELIAGLGKGLKKITVGNTGTVGLGGIGTKGAGGGLGGYGNTMVAAGEGAGLSEISVANNELTLQGGLSRYAINATIAKYLSQIRRCYEEELIHKPNIQGMVQVSFQVNANGTLNFAKVKSTTLNNQNVQKCMTTKMMSWQFPKPKGGVLVNFNYPFVLRPVAR